MKKLIPISLIFLIVFNTGGSFFIYLQLENYFKQIAFNRINEYIPIKNLERIEIDKKATLSEKNKIFKILNDKEILYNNKMYDIYMMEFVNDKMVLYCVSDENEDIIHNAFAEYLNEDDSSDNVKSITNIIKIFITLALVPGNNSTTIIQSKDNLTFFFDILFKNINIDIPYPPPKFIS